MEKGRKMFKCKIIFVLLLIAGIQSTFAFSEAPQIYYGGVNANAVDSYTFTYTLKSGDPNITKWQLKSSFFKRTDIELKVTAMDINTTSRAFIPLYIINPSTGSIEFNHESDHKFTPGIFRIYNVTVWFSSYTSIPTGEIEYQITWLPESQVTGSIFGPIDPNDLIEPWYSNIPLTIPIGLVFLIIVAWRLKLFNI